MSKYLLPDILQYILNDYLNHYEIEVYNRVFNFEFSLLRDSSLTPHGKINKYHSVVTKFYNNNKLFSRKTFYYDELIKDEEWYYNGSMKHEVNYKYGKLDGESIYYYIWGDMYFWRNYKNGTEENTQYNNTILYVPPRGYLYYINNKEYNYFTYLVLNYLYIFKNFLIGLLLNE
jgi:hypothetical protein